MPSSSFFVQAGMVLSALSSTAVSASLYDSGYTVPSNTLPEIDFPSSTAESQNTQGSYGYGLEASSMPHNQFYQPESETIYPMSPIHSSSKTPGVYTTDYTTTYVDICSTGYTTKTATQTVTYTHEETKTPATKGHVVPPPGMTITTKVCTACAKQPTTVTLVVPCDSTSTPSNSSATYHKHMSSPSGSVPVYESSSTPVKHMSESSVPSYEHEYESKTYESKTYESSVPSYEHEYESKTYESKTYESSVPSYEHKSEAHESMTYESKTPESMTYESKTYESKTYESKVYESKTYESKVYESKTYGSSSPSSVPSGEKEHSVTVSKISTLYVHATPAYSTPAAVSSKPVEGMSCGGKACSYENANVTMSYGTGTGVNYNVSKTSAYDMPYYTGAANSMKFGGVMAGGIVAAVAMFL